MSAPAYILTEDDVFDGKNRLGMDVSHIPLNVPLCPFCDQPIDETWCRACREAVLVEPLTETIGDPLLRRVA